MNARRIARVLVLSALFLMVPAHAEFHFMKIVEVFAGTPAAPNAQYVVLQMYVGGQQFVAGHAITVHSASGSQVASVSFPGDVANGANQATILVATADAQGFFDIDADLTMPAALAAGGGRVCFAGTVDCVAWGGWQGASTGVGTPFDVAAGLSAGRAATRRLDISGSASTLDPGDDTDNCVVDFVSAFPSPRNNAGASGSIPQSACGNDVLEGLEECDDGNLVSGDGCSSTCALDTATQVPVRGDFDGDGSADVFWRHQATGRNAIWRSGDAATTRPVAGVSDTEWELVGIGDFDGDGQADAFWRHQGHGRNAIWRSADSGARQAVTRVASLDWQVVGVGDFDGDGRDDVFWRNHDNGRNAIWRSGRSSTVQATASVSDLDWEVVGVGDFDGDGRDDALWRHMSRGGNVIWLAGNAAAQQRVASVSNQDWQVTGVGDFDGDGADDVFWRNRVSGRNAAWRGGNAGSALPVARVSNADWHVAAVGDYDGDGAADVFWRHLGHGRNVIWRSADATLQQPVARVSSLLWTVVPYDGPVPAPPPPDPAELPVLSIGDASAQEGDDGDVQVSFTVSLSFAAGAVTYDIATSAGTATAGEDYATRSLAGETIAAGQASRAFVVTIHGDTLEEGDETFSVVASNVSGATLGDGVARGTIRDDDYVY